MKNFKNSILAAGVLLWGFTGCSSSNTEPTTTAATTETVKDSETGFKSGMDTGTGPGERRKASVTSRDTTSFYVVASSNNMLETSISTQAQTKAQNAEVKNFAQQMVTDHSRSAEELNSMIARKNLASDSELVPMHQRMMVRLSREEDTDEYDEEYMEMQILLHKQAIELFESAAKNEKDPDLRAFASKSLPTLKMHLDMAKKTKDMVD